MWIKQMFREAKLNKNQSKNVHQMKWATELTIFL